mmetsp:Transcript_57812/g.160991  ORF Transcript_57812/g.160991 Transcript_57812/m.160991 type:complete len:370 (+) Transcript_57812:205-1314(+)
MREKRETHDSVRSGQIHGQANRRVPNSENMMREKSQSRRDGPVSMRTLGSREAQGCTAEERIHIHDFVGPCPPPLGAREARLRGSEWALCPGGGRGPSLCGTEGGTPNGTSTNSRGSARTPRICAEPHERARGGAQRRSKRSARSSSHLRLCRRRLLLLLRAEGGPYLRPLPLHLGGALGLAPGVAPALAGQALRLGAQDGLEAPARLEDRPVRHLPVPEEGLDADLPEGLHLHLEVRARQVEGAHRRGAAAPRARGELRDRPQPIGEERAEAVPPAGDAAAQVLLHLAAGRVARPCAHGLAVGALLVAPVALRLPGPVLVAVDDRPAAPLVCRGVLCPPRRERLLESLVHVLERCLDDIDIQLHPRLG